MSAEEKLEALKKSLLPLMQEYDGVLKGRPWGISLHSNGETWEQITPVENILKNIKQTLEQIEQEPCID